MADVSTAKQIVGRFLRFAGLLLLLVSTAHAQVFADLALSIELIPAKPLYYAGDEVRVVLTVTNLGPDTAPSAVVGMNTFQFGSPSAAQVGIYPTPAIAPCFWDQVTLEPGLQGVGIIRPFIHFPAIPAGTSLTCEVALLVATRPVGSYVLGGQVLAREGAIDAQPFNNTVNHVMAFGTAATSVTSIPGVGGFGLFLLVLAIATVALRFLSRA